MKILMVLTSHDKLGNTGRKTGFWLEEFAAPYSDFDVGYRHTGCHRAPPTPAAGTETWRKRIDLIRHGSNE